MEPQAEHTTALAIVGEAPGFHEDQVDRSWVGRTGQLLDDFMSQEYTNFSRYANVYLLNTCRCYPGTIGNPSSAHIKHCRPHLIADLELLYTRYTDVVLFLLGAAAVESLTGKGGLRKSFGHQGEPVQAGRYLFRCYRSYHPASLLRKPAQARVLEQHFRLVANYLKTGKVLPVERPITYCVGHPCPLK
jgi:DNA polymerase